MKATLAGVGAIALAWALLAVSLAASAVAAIAFLALLAVEMRDQTTSIEGGSP